jgi:hypothetical protein
MERGDFPTQDICDPKKPDEFAAWALVALPRMHGAALPMSSEYIQIVTQHLWDCGFRFHRKYQKIKWRAPSISDPHWLTNPGRWVDVNEPDPAPNERQPNMVNILRAMKKADEGDFLAALDEIGKEP